MFQQHSYPLFDEIPSSQRTFETSEKRYNNTSDYNKILFWLLRVSYALYAFILVVFYKSSDYLLV